MVSHRSVNNPICLIGHVNVLVKPWNGLALSKARNGGFNSKKRAVIGGRTIADSGGGNSRCMYSATLFGITFTIACRAA